MNASKNVIAASSGEVYYSGQYWNDFTYVRDTINKRATGSTKLSWFDHFFKQYPGPYKKVLMLNCGNGWLERELYEKGYIQELVGVDFAPDLLRQAKRENKKMPFRYYRMDINTAKFPERDFDLIINHAAAHHIAMLNKVFHNLAKSMTSNGLFVSYDYVGPHRNQYPLDQWEAAHALNKQLAPSTRQELKYPHLPTMLVDDPSEAIHAELIVPIMKRYFTFDFYHPIGGALAYPILTHNEAIQKASKATAERALQKIMAADKAFVKQFPESTLFAYWVARANKKALSDQSTLRAFQNEENARERKAKNLGGHYYPLELIQELYLELDHFRLMSEHKQSYIEELQKEIHLIKSSRSFKAARKLGEQKGKLKKVIKRRNLL